MKLFEFEELEEDISEVRNVNGICVLINSHLHDRLNNKRSHMDINEINAVIKRIPDVRNKFKTMDENSKFRIWSKSLNVGIGLRKRLDKDGYQRVEVMTPIDSVYDATDPVFYVG